MLASNFIKRAQISALKAFSPNTRLILGTSQLRFISNPREDATASKLNAQSQIDRMTQMSNNNKIPDTDAPLKYEPTRADSTVGVPYTYSTPAVGEEPRFLEQVQLFVDQAAQHTNVPPDMLKFLMACDHVLRF